MMPCTKQCPQCSASVNVRKSECVCGHVFCKRRSVRTMESKSLAMKNKRALEPEDDSSVRRERDRLSKSKKRALEPEPEAFLRKEQNKASMAKKRTSEPESDALLRK